MGAGPPRVIGGCPAAWPVCQRGVCAARGKSPPPAESVPPPPPSPRRLRVGAAGAARRFLEHEVTRLRGAGGQGGRAASPARPPPIRPLPAGLR